MGGGWGWVWVGELGEVDEVGEVGGMVLGLRAFGA